MIIQDKITELMREKKLTQAEFAKKIGMNQSAISSWLNGKSKPKFDAIKK